MKSLVKHKDNPEIQNLIIFVHGFTGGEKTFRNSSGKAFYEMLGKDIQDGCNYYSFIYYSRLFDFSFFKMFRGIVPGISKLFCENINHDIEDYSNLLNTHYFDQIARYKSIGFICHSMGGIIVKDLICRINSNGQKMPAFFVTLATPHKGVEEAKLGELIGNQQAKSLRPFSKKILELGDKWGKCTHTINTRYYCGLDDQLVNDFSSYPNDEQKDLFKVEGSHSSICKPDSDDCALIYNINSYLRNILGIQNIAIQGQLETQCHANLEAVIFTTYHEKSEQYYVSREVDNYIDVLSKSSNIWLCGDPGLGKTTILHRLMINNELSYDYIDLSPCPNNSSTETVLKELLSSLCNKYSRDGIVKNYAGNNLVTQIGSTLIDLDFREYHYFIIDEVPSLAEDEFMKFVESVANLATFYSNSGEKWLRFLVSTRNNPINELSKTGKEKFHSYFSPLRVNPWSIFELEKLYEVITSALFLEISTEDKNVAISRCSGSPRILKNAIRHFTVYSDLIGGVTLVDSVSIIITEGVY